MVQIITWVAIGLIALVLLSYLLPKFVYVSRSMQINANPDAVFQQVNDLANWENWSPWFQRDPDMKITYGENTKGIGAHYSWDGKKSGKGAMKIVDSVENQSVNTEIDFGPRGTAEGSWTFEAAENGTKATWGLKADMGNNPVGRIMGLFMDKMVGKDFEQGLNNLKSHLE